MSKLRSVNTSIWTDVWFESLDINKKLLFIYLITNEKTNMLGVYEISLRKISFETSIPVDIIKDCFDFFEKEGKIKYKCDRVILIKYIKHQNYNTNMKKSAIDCYNELPNELKIKENHILTRDNKGFETLYNGLLSLRKVEVEDEDELEEEIEDKEEQQQEQEIDVDVFDGFKNQIAQEGKTTWIESFYMKFKLKEKSLSKVMDEFILHVKCLPKGQPNTIQEFKQHFYNWCLKVDSFGKLDDYKKHKPKEKGAI